MHLIDITGIRLSRRAGRAGTALMIGLFLVLGMQAKGQANYLPTNYPPPPEFKPYKGIAGKVTKYNYFNYLEVPDSAGTKNRQAMGKYWEMSFSYDSVFRQKKKFRDFVINQVYEQNGTVFFEDTSQVNFGIPKQDGNVWGRLMLVSDKVYRLRLIREEPFRNKIEFYKKPAVTFDSYVDSVSLPPAIAYFPHSVITRAQVSKFDHQEFGWNVKDTNYREKVMGPFWDMRVEVRNSDNKVDRQLSTIEIMESYYRACMKAKGVVLRSRARELIFTLPLEKATLWVRITASLDGVYMVRAMEEANADRSAPIRTVTPVIPPDTTAATGKGDGRLP